MQYKAVGFDYNGVLAGMSHDVFDTNVSRILDIDRNIYSSTYYQYNHLLNHNTLSKEEFWKKLLAALQKEHKYQELISFFNTYDPHHIHIEVLSLAKKLKQLGYKIGILSNNTPHGFQKIKEGGFEDIFDTVLISSEVNMSKPDPNIFYLFAKQLDIQPHELIFIDDSPKSLESVGEVGFYPILYTTLEDLKNTLQNLQVLPM